MRYFKRTNKNTQEKKDELSRNKVIHYKREYFIVFPLWQLSWKCFPRKSFRIKIWIIPSILSLIENSLWSLKWNNLAREHSLDYSPNCAANADILTMLINGIHMTTFQRNFQLKFQGCLPEIRKALEILQTRYKLKYRTLYCCINFLCCVLVKPSTQEDVSH